MAAAFFLYLALFKVNLKHDCCYSILGQTTNTYTRGLSMLFYMYHVPCFEAAWSCHFKKLEVKLSEQENFGKKVLDVYKHLANSKVIVLKQY